MSGGGRMVLLAEDEAAARMLLARGLERHGYRVVAVGDGAAALPMLHRGWDAIVTDLSMPGLDGLELLRAVRAAGLAARRIVITSFADKDRAIAALNLGAHHLLEKPFSAAYLAGILDQVLAAAAGPDLFAPRLLALGLSEREQHLVTGVLRGQSNRQLAELLGVGEQTVKNNLSTLYQRLGVDGRGGLFHAIFPV